MGTNPNWARIHGMFKVARLARAGSELSTLFPVGHNPYREDPMPDRPSIVRRDSRGNPISLPKPKFLETRE